MRRRLALSLALLGLALIAPSASAEAATKVVLIAGRASHGAGEHEFNAGVDLLAKCLKERPGIDPVVVRGGWPADESILDGAATAVGLVIGIPAARDLAEEVHLPVLVVVMDRAFRRVHRQVFVMRA